MVFQKWVVQSWPVWVGSDSCPLGTWGSWPRWGIDISKLCLLFSFCISLSPWIYFHTYSTTPTEQYNMGGRRLAYVYNEMPVFSRIQWKRGWLLSIASGRWWLHFLSDRQSCPWKSTENSAFCSGPWENEIHVNPWYHFQDFKGKSTINGLLFHCLSLKCQGSLGWVLSQSLFSFYLTTCLQAISLLLISPFMNLLMIPGLLDRSLSDSVFTGQGNPSFLTLFLSLTVCCREGPHHPPRGHSRHIWTCWYFWSPSVITQCAGSVLCNRHPRNRNGFKFFPRLCSVSDASQQEGAIISSCRRGGELL